LLEVGGEHDIWVLASEVYGHQTVKSEPIKELLVE